MERTADPDRPKFRQSPKHWVVYAALSQSELLGWMIAICGVFSFAELPVFGPPAAALLAVIEKFRPVFPYAAKADWSPAAQAFYEGLK